MKHPAMNPYLPLWEYVPDGEPRIWGNRLYVYGSHDVAGSTQFCEGDYVVWSAPLDDLGSWKYEGISYPYTATTASLEEGGNLAAPDCVQGPDGRYYLYYNRGKYNPCEVAVSDTPQGPFSYLCNVTFPDGTIPATKMFDPGVLVDDDGRIYLYIGFCPTPDFPLALKLGKYSLGFELEPDMHTIKAGPFEVLPGCQATAGTGFEGHGFYEASSPRKIGKRYYLVYSSEQSHDLCYAVSDQPLTGYQYGGILVSNADIGRNGNTTPKAPYGNTHGGLVPQQLLDAAGGAVNGIHPVVEVIDLAAPLQLPAQLGGVVELPVVAQGTLAPGQGAHHRLTAVLRVDDRQPPVSQDAILPHPQAAVIRPPPLQGTAHPFPGLFPLPRPVLSVPITKSTNAAHSNHSFPFHSGSSLCARGVPCAKSPGKS